ncbi:alpha/beta hydrolase family protein [Bradyrhizobium betae]|uniref:Alpha/beta hydrolase n=1 Tax=Bradyrhizobium betae TaxID=244734 RepID=A0A4Q1UKN7_9BRAD|nr:alpha/beta hydrolase [Bradyrhizobium betae]RXT35441.1 alpha/beta hydrolase [Bradyrhizobium betae]
MDGDHSPHSFCDSASGSLAHLRERASAFFERLPVAELARDAQRRRWVSDWARIGDDYLVLAESAGEAGSSRFSGESYLCAMTAHEVARSLSCSEDAAGIDLADKIGLSLGKLEDRWAKRIERVEIDYLGQATLEGFFVSAACNCASAPAVICVGDEEADLGAVLARLLPALLGRGVSLLLVDGRNASVSRSRRPEHALGCWLDYLDGRPDVDSNRIGVYGEGAGASHASRLACSDRRIAAAVCDGGFWASHRLRASVRWITGVWHEVGGDSPTRSLPTARRVPCPILVAVGRRSMVREEDALELQAAYHQSGAHCSVVVPNAIRCPLGEVENFVAVDDFVFDWFGDKFGPARQIDPLAYL